ncbi:MAG: hypothetical protein FJW99_05500 [Actinobacteria bacterium]|nr:hypothetical protein [Actinomycetota bacterium]
MSHAPPMSFRPRRRRHRAAASACLAAFMVPVTVFGWFTADAAAAVAAQPGREDVTEAPKAPHQVQGNPGFDPRTLPALPAGDATGPLVPELQGVTLDGTLGLSTSLTPSLAWPGGPDSGVTFTIKDLAGKLVWSQRVDANGTRVPPNRLKQGGVYEWGATAGGSTFGPYQVRVDFQRPSVQPTVEFGGVSIAGVTGEVLIALATPATEAVSGPVGVTLSYRPSESKAIAPSIGVPAGWHVASTGDAPWSNLRRVSANRIDLYSNDGGVVPFRQSSPGAWTAVWGKGQTWPGGQYATLSQAVDSTTAAGEFQVTDRSGEVTTFPATAAGAQSRPTGTWSARMPTLRTAYDGTGRLVSLTDPVSGRQALVKYGGSGTCPVPAGPGLRKAPKGMLCRVTGWDGTGTDVFYRATDGPAGPLIARIVTDAEAGPGALQQTDIGYDATGRPSALRGPLANAAVASGVIAAAGVTTANADDANVLTTIAYDAAGRVQQIRRPAAIIAGSPEVPARGERTFEYPSPGSFRVWSPGRDRPLSESVASPRSMLVKSGRDSGGRLQTTTWDSARQVVTEQVEPGGLVTRYRYNAQGEVTDSFGPSVTPQAGGAPRTRFTYDTQVPQGGGPGTPARAITGLQATVWKGTAFEGTPWKGSVGPRIAGSTPASLAYSWTDASRSPYSARLEGTITVPVSGISRITNVLRASQVWVDGVRCDGDCPESLDLAARAPGSQIPIRIDVRSDNAGTGAVSVQWMPKGGQAAPIPSSALRPELPQPTATAVRDQVRAGGSLADLTTHSTYSASNPRQMVGARSASGLTNTRTYEAYDPAAGSFGRATGALTAAGTNIAMAYYAPGEKAAIASCAGAAANQGGLPKSMTTPGGRTVVNSYDASGRVVGQRTAGAMRTCTTYDLAGRPLTVTVTGAATGGGGVSRVAYGYAPDGNPMALRQTFPDTDIAPEVVNNDLLGRAVGTTDSWGTNSSVSYDELDNPVATTIRTAAGERTTTNATYTVDGSTSTISRDGQVLATAAYQDSTGLLQSVTYANGAVASLGYDAQGNASTRTIEVAGQTMSDTAAVSPAGRTLRRAIAGPGAATATWDYGYDKDGRLTSAALGGAVPAGVRGGTWSYALDAASQRTRITSPYTSTAGFTYAYSPTGAVTGTSDPRFAGGFAYDPLGRATTAGPLSLAYDAQGVASRISDGTVTEERTSIPSGVVVATSITANGITRTARSTLGGLLLDNQGRITSQSMALPGAVSVQLPPPGGAAPTLWRYADIQGSIAWEGADGAAPATTSLYDPDGNRLNGAALSLDPATPNLLFNSEGTAPLAAPVTHMGEREYVAQLGIFLQPDPLPASSSTAYNYAASDPINAQDPSGGFFLFDGQWWKDHGGTALRVTIAVVTTIAVSAVTAGAATGPAVAFLSTVAAGAVGGFAGDVVGQVAENAVNGDNPLDIKWSEAGIAAGIGGAVGVIGGGFKAYRLLRAGRGAGGAAADVSFKTSSSMASNPNSIIQRARAPWTQQANPFSEPELATLERVWSESRPRFNPLGAGLRDKMYPRFGKDERNMWRLDVDVDFSF